MFEGQCHCGSIEFKVSGTPKWLTDCNCTICRRIGALWGHVEINQVEVSVGGEGTISYVQGDKTLAIHSCKICGCTTHWENLQPQSNSWMAVNFRMCAPAEVASFRVRRFDGADTWEFLD